MKASATGFHTKERGVGTLFDGVCVVEGKRTPFGKFTGSLSSVSPTDLGIIVSKATIAASGLPAEEIDQIYAGNLGPGSGDSLYFARHIGLYSGAPLTAPAVLVQRLCGTGIEIIGNAAEQIALNKANVVLGCGVEVMSRYPLVSFSARQGFPLGRPEFIDLLWDGLNDTAAVPMGKTADKMAQKYELSRDEVDQFALQSQSRYFDAQSKGFFEGEVIPVSNTLLEMEGYPSRKVKLHKTQSIETDEHPRETSLEKLAKLPPVFSKKGPTTAGTASGIVDGAGAALVVNQDYAEAHGLKILGKVRAVATVGVDPSLMGIGPVPAIQSVLEALKLEVNDIDFFEINEAFGAQCLGVAKALGIDSSKLNVHGGAISIGHPLAATGVRLVTTLLKTMNQKGGQLGVASACIGGGQGIALVLERSI